MLSINVFFLKYFVDRIRTAHAKRSLNPRSRCVKKTIRWILVHRQLTDRPIYILLSDAVCLPVFISFPIAAIRSAPYVRFEQELNENVSNASTTRTLTNINSYIPLQYRDWHRRSSDPKVEVRFLATVPMQIDYKTYSANYKRNMHRSFEWPQRERFDRPVGRSTAHIYKQKLPRPRSRHKFEPHRENRIVERRLTGTSCRHSRLAGTPSLTISSLGSVDFAQNSGNDRFSRILFQNSINANY